MPSDSGSRVRAARRLRAVPESPVDQRAASDAVHRKAEGRPHTGCMRTLRQRGVGVPPAEGWGSAVAFVARLPGIPGQTFGGAD
jgi:hypothetical protein